MQNIIIYQKSDNSKLAELSVDFMEKDPEIVAMYCLQAMLLYAEKGPDNLIKFIFSMRHSLLTLNADWEKTMLDSFRENYYFECQDISKQVNEAKTMEDLFQ